MLSPLPQFLPFSSAVGGDGGCAAVAVRRLTFLHFMEDSLRR